MKTIIPGKINRREHIANCVEYFRRKYPEHYAAYAAQNAMRRDTRQNKFGTIAKGVDDELADDGFREGVTVPEMLIKMINAELPDPTDSMKIKAIIDPPFLQSGKGGHEFARRELGWFRKTFPIFATSQKW